MTRDDAVFLSESRFWEQLSYRERAMFQLWEERLCMPFEVFHEAVEKALDRPVYTHEFGLNLDGLRRELLGDQPAPTLDDILALIPADKRVVIVGH
jgi:hypothetical protein